MAEFAVFEEIKLLPEDVLNCTYSSWHKYFEKYTYKSVTFRPLSQAFIDYLSSDGLTLPKDPREEEIIATSDNEYSDWESENEDAHESASNADPTAKFKDLHDKLVSTIEDLGGAVTPKMNWSAPKDAKWILMNNSLKCTNVNDIYMLLNASDHIVHDLEYAFDDCENGTENNHKVQHELVIKKWVDIVPALEFRVFIKDKKILGISQRDLNFYDYLEKLKPELHEKIIKFFNGVLLPSGFPMSSYILDIYIPRPFNKVYIIDINPFSRKSDSLLFTWHELLSNKSNDHEFRLISENNVRQFSKKEYSESQVPLDVIDAAMNSESMIELAKKWQELQVKGSDN